MMFTDHLGRTVALPQHPPQRIISLCPSQTELLFHLGAGPQVVGATQWCVHPQPAIEAVTKLGGTKKVNYKKLDALQPDLILCEKEENTHEMVERLSSQYPVYVTNVEGVADALRMITDVGALVGQPEQASALAAQITNAFAALPRLTKPRSVAYLIWKDPYMGVGTSTYIDDVLARCGFMNVFAGLPSRYPAITLPQLVKMQPKMVLLSSEPYAFGEEHIAELQAQLPSSTIRLVDGEMFSWYGSRMLQAAQYLAQFLKELS